MSRLTQLIRFGMNRESRRGTVDRRRRFAVESLEGRQLLTLGFTSAIGIGGNVANVQRIALDAQGDTYVTGFFRNKVSFDPGSGGGNVLDAGNTTNAFVAKYSPTNTLVWVKQFSDDESVAGGASAGEGIAVDNNTGAVYVTGTFSGKVDFDPGGNTLFLTSAGNNDGFVVKLSSNGDLVPGLAKRFGGVANETTTNLTLDRTGTNLYISGSYTNTANFDPGGTNTSLTSPTANQPDAFALKLSSSLGFEFVARAGLANSTGNDVAADSQGNVYLVGSQTPGAGNAFIAKFNGVGTLATEKLFGGPISGGTAALGTGLVIDASDNVYVGGGFVGTGVNFNKFNGVGTVALDSAGSFDAFLIKLDPSTTLVWARRFGSKTADLANDLGIDGNNNLYLTGFETGLSSFGTTGLGTQVLDSGNGMTNTVNGFVLEVDASGNFVQATGIGGTGQSDAFGIAVTGAGEVAIGGFYTAPATFGNTTLQALGTQQFFVATLNSTSSNNNGGGTNGGGTNGGGSGPGTMAAPSFVSEARIIARKGRKKKIVAFQLNFNGGLNAGEAQNTSHYHVTQPGKKHRVTPISVLAATYNPGNDSVTLILGKFKANKPLQLTASGLTGNGASVATFVTNL